MKTVRNIDQFLEFAATSKLDEFARIDRRYTIEVGYRSNQGEMMPGHRGVVPVARFVKQGARTLAQTESGDIWPFGPHKSPHVADYFAYPGA